MQSFQHFSQNRLVGTSFRPFERIDNQVIIFVKQINTTALVEVNWLLKI